jgi:hypothetical protein
MEDTIESIKAFFLIKPGRVTVPCDIAFGCSSTS